MKVHIVNGDHTGNKLKNIDGKIIVWREMYDMGPLTPEMNRQGMKQRASFFEKKLGVPGDLFLETCRQQEQSLASLPKNSEITLWFEHDRYDQTMLLYLLKTIGNIGFTNLFLVTANAHPGVEPFFGLGQLSESQLELLLARRIPIATEWLSQASEGWGAYASSNPGDLENWLHHGACDIPYTKEALQHHFHYYPSEKNGLSEVEEATFKFLYDGMASFHELFQNVKKQRSQDGISDLYFAALLNELYHVPYPLIKVTGGSLPRYNIEPEDAYIELTRNGIEVLMEREDRVELAPPDWWLGGVHINSGKWRWNGNQLIDTAKKQV